jgi:MSHA pilin protein MshC
MSVVHIKRFSGFSLIELIAVILLLGILSVAALGRLATPSQFALKAFFNDTVNAVRFSQKLAVSTGCDVQVKMTTAGYQLRQGSTCTANDYDDADQGVPVNNPANRSVPYENLTTGYKLGMIPTIPITPITSIVFNARGVLDSGINVTYTVSDADTSYSFIVFGQTGLVDVL